MSPRAQLVICVNFHAVNSRLFDRQKRRHENHTCCDGHVVQSVDCSCSSNDSLHRSYTHHALHASACKKFDGITRIFFVARTSDASTKCGSVCHRRSHRDSSRSTKSFVRPWQHDLTRPTVATRSRRRQQRNLDADIGERRTTSGRRASRHRLGPETDCRARVRRRSGSSTRSKHEQRRQHDGIRLLYEICIIG